MERMKLIIKKCYIIVLMLTCFNTISQNFEIRGIVYEDKNGQVYKKTIHQSNKFRCEDVVIDPRDYLSLYGGLMPYGKFDAEEHKKYKEQH